MNQSFLQNIYHYNTVVTLDIIICLQMNFPALGSRCYKGLYVTWLSAHTISSIRNRQIFFTSLAPVTASVWALFSSLSCSPVRIASFLFSRAHMTKGKPNLSLYLRFRLFIRWRSSSVIVVRPALACSRVDSDVSCPTWASLPARSGCKRRIPSFPSNQRTITLSSYHAKKIYCVVVYSILRCISYVLPIVANHGQNARSSPI